jgi:hypothetical protein
MKHHPEQQEGQIYMGNGVVPGLRFNPLEWGFEEMGWKSRTFGKVAYNIYGKVLENMAPIFIDEAEVLNAIQSEQDRIAILGDKAYGAKENIQVWQRMVDAGTVFVEK